MATGLAAADLRSRRDRRDRRASARRRCRPDHRRTRADRARSSSTRCGFRSPLLDLRLYRRPTFASASFAMFCLGAALFGGMILLPLYWQGIRHESVLDTGLLTAPQGLGMALVMPLAGQADRPLRRRPVRAVRRDRDDARDDSVRPVGAHTSIVGLSVRDVRPRHRHRLRVHARDDRRVRFARALRAVRRDAAAERAPARRRLDRHGGAGGRAPARAGRGAHASPAAASRLRHRVLGLGRADGARDRPVRRSCCAPSARRGRRAEPPTARRRRRRWRRRRHERSRRSDANARH